MLGIDQFSFEIPNKSDQFIIVMFGGKDLLPW